MWRRVVVHLVLAVLGIFGGLFPAVADIWPNSSIIDLFPTIGSLDSGFKNLTEFTDQTSDGKPIGILEENDRGYDQTYDLLRNINPGIPPREEEAHGEKLIFVKNILSWDMSTGSVPLSAIVHIHFRKDQTSVPVCELGNLVAGVRDRKVAVWSSAGLTVLAITFLGQIVLLLGSTRLPERPQAEILVKTPLPITLKDETSREKVRYASGYGGGVGFVLALLIGFALGMLQSSKNK